MNREPGDLEAGRESRAFESGMYLDDIGGPYLEPAARNDDRPGVTIGLLVFSLGFTLGFAAAALLGVVQAIWWSA